MVDKHGQTIKENDILLGSFRGQGGRWIAYAIVRDSEVGLVLELAGHCIHAFTHPKFRLPSRREIVPALPDGWNSIDKWNRENDNERAIRKCKYCDVQKNEAGVTKKGDDHETILRLQQPHEPTYQQDSG